MSQLKSRLKKLDHLSERMDAIAIFNSERCADPNFFYFTNTDVSGIFYYDFSKPVIYTNEMELSRARKTSRVKNITTQKIDFGRNRKIGINKSFTLADTFENIKKTENISKQLEEIRVIKNRYEIQCISKACGISKKIFYIVQDEIKNTTEIELAALIDTLIAKNGCQPAFPTIVAAGSNVVYPHHRPTTKKLTEPILLDFGAKYRGYCSDISRTIGSPYTRILERIIEDTESIIKKNVKAADLDVFVRRELGKLEKHFIHGLGHGFGVAVHERPWISRGSTDVLKNGMVFTIEPGVYLKGGCRIEHDYVLNEGGVRRLD